MNLSTANSHPVILCRIVLYLVSGFFSEEKERQRERERERERKRERGKKSTVGSMNKMLVIEIVNRRVGRDGGCWYGREGGGGGKRRRGRKCRRSK